MLDSRKNTTPLEKKELAKAEKSIRKFRIAIECLAEIPKVIDRNKPLRTISFDVYSPPGANGLEPWMFIWCDANRGLDARRVRPQTVEMRIAVECRNLMNHKSIYQIPSSDPIVIYNDNICLRYADIERIYARSNFIFEFIEYSRKKDLQFDEKLSKRIVH